MPETFRPLRALPIRTGAPTRRDMRRKTSSASPLPNGPASRHRQRCQSLSRPLNERCDVRRRIAACRRAGCRHSGDANEGGYTDCKRPDDREGELPALGRHGVLHDTMGCMKAGDHGRCDERSGDEQARPGRADRGKQELTEAEGQSGCHEAKEDGAGPSRTCIVCPCSSSHACEKRESVHGKREEQAAEESDGGEAEKNSDEDRGGVSV